MKILVVDDSSTMRRIAIRSLAEIGQTDFVEAANGQAALDAFEKGGFGLVITDWNMPVMNGLELVTELRKLDAEVPVMMVTTNGSSKDVIEALKAGVNNYIVKPFTAETLREKVQSLMEE